jgi:glycosyltransferase involved in cell wall biosynthesis
MIDGVEIINVSLTGGAPAIVARMLAETRAARPALIHLFKPKGYGGLAATGLRLAGRRLVVDNDDWEGPGGWNDRVSHYTPAQRQLFAWQAWTLPRSAHAVTVACRALEEQAVRHGIPPARLRYVPNGVSRRRHAGWEGRAWQVEPAAEPLLALYTRFDVFQPERLVAMVGAIRRQEPRARVLVVGQGLAGEHDRARVVAARAGLADAFEWAGFVPFEDLPERLARTWVGLYPIDDTLINRAKAPMKLLELMALGLPVVGEAVGEVGEYIQPEISGRLVAPGDQETFAAAVVELLGAPERRAALGQAAAERVWRHYAWERLTGAVEEVYSLALAGQRTR